jgi:hypothetical protein
MHMRLIDSIGVIGLDRQFVSCDVHRHLLLLHDSCRDDVGVCETDSHPSCALFFVWTGGMTLHVCKVNVAHVQRMCWFVFLLRCAAGKGSCGLLFLPAILPIGMLYESTCILASIMCDVDIEGERKYATMGALGWGDRPGLGLV